MDDIRLTRSDHDNAEALGGQIEEPRTIRAWAQARLGATEGRLTVSQVLAAIPRRKGLRWHRAADSPLGGRIAPHLRHLDDDQARALEARGQAFLDATDLSEEDFTKDSGDPCDELARLESAIDRR